MNRPYMETWQAEQLGCPFNGQFCMHKKCMLWEKEPVKNAEDVAKILASDNYTGGEVIRIEYSERTGRCTA